MKVLRFLTIVSFLALIISTKISAQSGISVSPPRTYFALNPGESERKNIMVTNVSDVHTLELSVSFNDNKHVIGLPSMTITELNEIKNKITSFVTSFNADKIFIPTNEIDLTQEVNVIVADVLKRL